MLNGNFFQVVKKVFTLNLSLIFCISNLQEGAMAQCPPLNTLLIVSMLWYSSPAWSNYEPAEQFCTSLVDYKQRQPFFFEERYDFGTKIGTSQIDSN